MERNIFLTGCMICTATIISAIAAFSLDSGHFLLKFVNAMFYVALPLITIGGFMFIIERGSFNIIRYGFRKFFKGKNEKIASMIEEEEPLDDKEILYRTYSFRWTYPIVITGILLAAVSMIISFTVFV
ncbi:DUF3899 domain-containing protein [Microbacteriaceae bacterium 4G12]